MDEGLGFALVPIFVIVFLASDAQAAAPADEPESRFVWETGKNLIFTWTAANFDGFFYDAQSRAGSESLTIKLGLMQKVNTGEQQVETTLQHGTVLTMQDSSTT